MGRMLPFAKTPRNSLLVEVAMIALVAVAVAACNPFTSSGAAPDDAGSSFPNGPIPGNSVNAPLPTDAPQVVVARDALPDCGAQINFEEDVDISPIPTAPGPVSNDADNKQAQDCLIAAWENGLKAEMRVSAISDEADEIYTIYRLPGDGTVQLIVRVRSHTELTVMWTQAVCRQLSIQDGVLTPADCASETTIK
jgi:hypothetical protein